MFCPAFPAPLTEYLDVPQSTPNLKNRLPVPEAVVERIYVPPKPEGPKYLKFELLLQEPLSQPVEKPSPTIAFCANNRVGIKNKMKKNLL